MTGWRRAPQTPFQPTAAGLALIALTGARAAAQAGQPTMPRELHNRDGSFSDIARSMAGERHGLEGYMAPPLKPEAQFFVFTQRPVVVCPFCETSADRPDDILAVYPRRIVDPVCYTVELAAEGVLVLDEYRDPETGFLKRGRPEDATYS